MIFFNTIPSKDQDRITISKAQSLLQAHHVQRSILEQYVAYMLSSRLCDGRRRREKPSKKIKIKNNKEIQHRATQRINAFVLCSRPTLSWYHRAQPTPTTDRLMKNHFSMWISRDTSVFFSVPRALSLYIYFVCYGVLSTLFIRIEFQV